MKTGTNSREEKIQEFISSCWESIFKAIVISEEQLHNTSQWHNMAHTEVMCNMSIMSLLVEVLTSTKWFKLF